MPPPVQSERSSPTTAIQNCMAALSFGAVIAGTLRLFTKTLLALIRQRCLTQR